MAENEYVALAIERASMPRKRTGLHFQARTGNDFVDAVYSLTADILEKAGAADPEAAALLQQLLGAEAFQIAFSDDLWSLVADDVDMKVGMREADVKTLVAAVQEARAKQRPN